MHDNSIIRNYWADALLWVIALAYAAYLFLRAWYIPMTQDEVATCYNHVIRSVWDIMTYSKEAVPNNHILNTLCIKLLSSVFGMNSIVARIPTLMIGGGIYVLASVALARQLGKTRLLKVSFLIVLLGNPYMTEFFALARGYGMSMGLLMAAIFYSWFYSVQGQRKHLFLAVLTSGLAVWASFTALYFFLPWLLFMVVLIWQREASGRGRGQAFLILLPVAFVFALLWSLPIYRMQADDQLHFWGTRGFFEETIQPLVKFSTMGHPYLDQYTTEILTGLVTIFFIGAFVVALWRWYVRKWRLTADPMIFSIFLLAGTVAVNLALAYILKVPFLNPRTAIFYYPLFAFALISAASVLAERYGTKALWFATPLSLFTLVNFDNNRNLKQSYEWAYDRGTYAILDYLTAAYISENRAEPFSLDCNWLHQNSLHFHLDFNTKAYSRMVTMPNFFHTNEPPRGNTDFYYTAEPADIQHLKELYEPVLVIQPDQYVLMRRRSQ